MKRKVLCFFSLLLIFLLFFTLVSPKVEEEMATLAETKIADGRGTYNVAVGAIAIDWGSEEEVLFNIIEGKGWTSGLRLAEIPPRAYTRYKDHIEIGPGTRYWYVYSASRKPVSGGTVRAVDIKYRNDTYLIYHPASVGELNILPNTMKVLNRAENVALLSNWNGAYPFFEHNMWYTFKETVGQEVRIYSMHDVEQFTKALPWIAGVISALLCSILLWGGTWILTREDGCSKKVWMGNIGLIGLLLGAVPLLYSLFDLPASLMPREFILDISHYVEEFRRIMQSMASMGDYRVYNWLTQATMVSTVILGVSILLAVGLLLAESKLRHKKEKM